MTRGSHQTVPRFIRFILKSWTAGITTESAEVACDLLF